MADNVAITAGSGTTIATDDVSGVQFQKIKLDAGGDGVSVPVVAGQQTMAASMPVVLASNQTAVPGSVADGSSIALGATTDAAVETDTTGTVSGKLRGLVKLFVNFLSRLPAALGANGGLKIEGVASGTVVPISDGGGAITVDGTVSVTISTSAARVSSGVTRPSDTTAYAAGDAVTDSTSAPTAITFSGCAKANAGSGTIYSVQCVDSAAQTTKAQLELWIFAGTSAPTPDNDNAAFTPTDGELANLIGVVEFNAWYVGDASSGASGNCVSRALNQNIGFVCGASVDDLYGLVVVRNAYTPVSGESFTFILHIGQD